MNPTLTSIERWKDLRFGMFIHWGVSSLTGGEIGWSRGAVGSIEEYDNLYKRFNPTEFRAEEWVRLARDAGMKYMVLTTKHHDGFCLWDTRQTDYNIMNSPFRRDVVKELSTACRKHGMPFGAYYSICDWRHPDFPFGGTAGKEPKPNPNLDRYTAYLKAQVTELVQQYGPFLTLWFDVPQAFDKERGADLVDFVRSLQPDILINNRTMADGDYNTPEQRIGRFQNARPWESCITLCEQWAWKPNDRMKPLEQCIATLVNCAGGDGNLLLNVGPTSQGDIEPRQADRLRDIGRWLQKYGESIFATRGGPYLPGDWGVCTHRGNAVYLHVLNGKDSLELPALPAQIRSAQSLDGSPVTCTQSVNRLRIAMPEAHRDGPDTVVKLTIQGDAAKLALLKTHKRVSLAIGKPVVASSYFEENLPEFAVDGKDDTRWKTASTPCWIEVDLGKPVMIQEVRIVQYKDRIREYELQRDVNGAWETFYRGTTIGFRQSTVFPPIEVRRLRLNITKAEARPAIIDFEVFQDLKEQDS